jgi:site-specific DNA-methyltransferase (adenine-specific)
MYGGRLMLLNKVLHGDCLELMGNIPDKSIDMILCDLPYGTTECKWDTVIPFEPLWEHYKRVIKDNGAIVLFGSEPFSSKLRMSNIKNYKYDWVWDKVTAKGHLVAKIRPLQQTENISVFGKNRIMYYPQMVARPKNKIKTSSEGKRSEIMGGVSKGYKKTYTKWYPKTLLKFKVETELHPTQKPVALFEYLIKTYTNEGDLILDNCAGSGTTAIAAIKTGRKYILMEKEKKYIDIINKRIKDELKQGVLFNGS